MFTRRQILAGVASLIASIKAKASLLGVRGASLIDDDVEKPLRFTAEQANSTIELSKVGSAPDIVDLVYSINGASAWESLDHKVIKLTNIGDYVEIKKTTKEIHALASNVNDYNKFSMRGLISASGNLYSMLTSEYEGLTDLTGLPPYLLCRLFYNCKSLTTPPDLPAIKLSSYCYAYLFDECSKLAYAPKLRSKGLSSYCYYNMFRGCTSLLETPELPADTLYSNCYSGMFSNCTSLVYAGNLKSETGSAYCYYNMFRGCTSLVVAPEIYLRSLSFSNCCSYMFYGCSRLNYIKVHWSSFREYDTNRWVSGVSSSGDFYYNGRDTAIGVSGIPEGWNIHTF